MKEPTRDNSLSSASINAPGVQIPFGVIWRVIQWPFRKLSRTHPLERNLDNLLIHTKALTEIVHMIVADISGKWTMEQRLEVQKQIANFRIVSEGLSKIIPKGNPFTSGELQRLQNYTQQASEGKTFTPEEAKDFKELSDRAALDYPKQDWVKELLKVAIFIFALYALSQVLKKK